MSNVFFESVLSRFIFPLFMLAVLTPVIVTHAQTAPPQKVSFRIEPSNERTNHVNRLRISGICYSLISAKPAPCRFEYQYKGLGSDGFIDNCVINAEGKLDAQSCSNGGHTHGGGRPVTFDDSSPIVFEGFDEDQSHFGVAGSFDYINFPGAVFFIDTFAPVTAGVYSWDTKLRTPTGWFFRDGPGVQPDFREMHIAGTTIVGVENLRQLPDGEHYIKVRSPDSSHVDAVAFAASELMILAIDALAKAYNRLSGDKNFILSVNDISLPMGGILDLKNDWQYPHKSHRGGLDADLNKRPGNSAVDIPCSKDDALHDAAREVLEPYSSRRSSAILCEPFNNDNKHLDFTGLVRGDS